MQARLDFLLMDLARNHAPELLSDPLARSSTAALARRLASYGVLVIAAEIDHLINPYQTVNEWVHLHRQFYTLLAEGLFPSYTAVRVQPLDNGSPVLTGLFGAATPVVQVMAGYVIPYVSYCQHRSQRTTEAELRGIMDIVLEELEAVDLPRPRYTSLRGIGIALIQHLIGLHIRQFSLTAFDRPVADDLPTEPMPSVQDTRPMAPIREDLLPARTTITQTQTVAQQLPSRPTTLPGTGSLNPRSTNTGRLVSQEPPQPQPTTAPETSKTGPLSDTGRQRAIQDQWSSASGGGGAPRRRPPVPDLPE